MNGGFACNDFLFKQSKKQERTLSYTLFTWAWARFLDNSYFSAIFSLGILIKRILIKKKECNRRRRRIVAATTSIPGLFYGVLRTSPYFEQFVKIINYGKLFYFKQKIQQQLWWLLYFTINYSYLLRQSQFFKFMETRRIS